MRDRQHVWVDGSLSDGVWYSQVIKKSLCFVDKYH